MSTTPVTRDGNRLAGIAAPVPAPAAVGDRSGISRHRNVLFVLAVAWTAFAVYGSLVPLLYHQVSWADAIDRFRNLPPLWFGMGTRADWVANILLFVPLTFFWLGTLAWGRGRVVRVIAATLVTGVAAAAAVALEFTQIWFSGRTVSRNDILAEIIGAAIGVFLWFGVGERVVGWFRDYATDRQSRSQVIRLLQLYVVGFLIYSVVPLDLTISLTELYDKYRRGLVLLVPFSYSYASVSTVVYQFFADIMVFVPVGAWLAMTGIPARLARSPLVGVAVAGAIIASMVEFAQLLVLSRFTDVTDILLGTIGAGLGGKLVAIVEGLPATKPLDLEARGRWRSAAPWLAAIAAYTAFVAVGLLYPFDFTNDHELIRTRLEGFLTRIPFLALYLGDEFNAIKQFLVRVLTFAPLGVCWAFLADVARTAWARRALSLLGVVYACGLAFGIELIQVFMPARIADLTEVGLCTIGAAGGLYLTSRILRARRGDRRL